MRRWLFLLVLGGASLVWASSPSAAPSSEPASSAASAAAPPPKLPNDADLPALVALPPIKRAELDPDAAKELERLLGRLTSQKRDIREAALAELGKVDEALVPAIHARVQLIRESLDRDQAPRIIETARKSAREQRKAEKRSKKAKDEETEEDSDWLRFVLADAKPDSDTWREVVELLAMVRLLRTAGTTPAVRELLELRANFGEMLRVDLIRQLLALGDRAVPALLEAKKHDASNVRELADKVLDTMGKVTPGEAVSTAEPEILADTLRAFGYVRDVDAVDVLLSFANHDRKKVRDAARQAVASIGEPGRFRLRDAYQDLTGEKVDKSVTWDVLARRMFFLYDQARAAEIVRVFDAGVALANAKSWNLAAVEFDKVLAIDPQFDKRAEMSATYFELGKQTSFDEPELRLARLRKARRLVSKPSPRVDAEIAYTEAKMLLDEGRPDRFLLKRALELDPEHAEAQALMASFESEATRRAAAVEPTRPYTLAGGIAAGALALAAVVALLPRRKRRSPVPGALAGDSPSANKD
jgi:tetratricopeptide (TPR) repeat protein